MSRPPRPPAEAQGDEAVVARAVESVRERYRAVTDSMQCGVVVLNPDGEIRFANPAAGRILGLAVGQIHGRTPLDPRWASVHEDGSPFPGHDHPASVALRDQVEVRDVVMGVMRPDGALRWILVNASPLAPIADAPSGVVATFVDITSERELREHLELSLTLLRQSTQEQAALASAISHDLATPVAALRILTDLLAQPDSGPIRDEVVASARAAAHRVETLVSELAETAARMRARHEPQRQRADLRGLVSRACAMATHPVSCIVPDHPVWADVDPPQIDRIVDNLITNAVKHGRAAPAISVTLRDAGSEAEIVVEDDGPGIPCEHHEAIFEPFVRLTERAAGHGVGLYLVREFARFHSGTARCENRTGGGSRFVVRLPTSAVAPSQTG